MRNAPLEWEPSEYKDCETINYWDKVCLYTYKTINADHRQMKEKCGNDPNKLDFARNVIQRKARDHSRTPVPWNEEANAGFCPPGVKPWMRVMDDYKEINAASQAKTKDPERLTILQFWQRGLADRKKHKDALVYGDFVLLDDQHPTVFAYRRVSKEETFVIILNFHGKHTVFNLAESDQVKMWVAGNYTSGKPAKPLHGMIALRPWEGLIGIS